MQTLKPITMVEKSTIVSLKFDRNDRPALARLSEKGLVITRDKAQANAQVSFSVPDINDFTLSETDMDFEEIRGRTKSLLRCVRAEGENLQLKLSQSEADSLECNEIFLYFAGDDEFILMAESPFKLVNKVYKPSLQLKTDIALSDDLKCEIAEVDAIDNKGVYSRDKIVRYRHIIIKLDELIERTSTNQLRQEAYEAKRVLEDKVRELRVLRKMSHMSKAVQDEVKHIRFNLMAKFIEENHGKQALVSIESEAIRMTASSLKADQELVNSALDSNSELELELNSINERLEAHPYKDELYKFINKPLPPSFRIHNCGKCGSRARLVTIPLDTKAQKAFEVRCKCGSFERGTRPAATAISKWNLAQGTGELADIDGIDFVGLSKNEINTKVKDIERFTNMINRKFALEARTQGDRYHKANNKIKGMNKVLATMNDYAKRLIPKQ